MREEQGSRQPFIQPNGFTRSQNKSARDTRTRMVPCHEGLFDLNIESHALCLYAQIHLGAAAIFGGAGALTLMCMAAVELWPPRCVVAAAVCLVMAMGPEGLLALGTLLAYRTLRRRRQTHLDPTALVEYGQDEEGEEDVEEIPTADHPVGIPVCGVSLGANI